MEVKIAELELEDFDLAKRGSMALTDAERLEEERYKIGRDTRLYVQSRRHASKQ